MIILLLSGLQQSKVPLCYFNRIINDSTVLTVHISLKSEEVKFACGLEINIDRDLNLVAGIVNGRLRGMKYTLKNPFII
jgi:hypothetical protein